MPKGFYIDSGKHLPLKLLQLVAGFYQTLRDAAKQGRITRATPLTADQMCRRYKKFWQEKGVQAEIEDSEIRAMVNYCRRHGILICSSGKGYWSGDETEIQDVLISMKQREAAIREAREGLEAGLELRQKLRDELMKKLKEHNNGQIVLDNFTALEAAEAQIAEHIEHLFEQAIEQDIQARKVETKGEAA